MNTVGNRKDMVILPDDERPRHNSHCYVALNKVFRSGELPKHCEPGSSARLKKKGQAAEHTEEMRKQALSDLLWQTVRPGKTEMLSTLQLHKIRHYAELMKASTNVLPEDVVQCYFEKFGVSEHFKASTVDFLDRSGF